MFCVCVMPYVHQITQVLQINELKKWTRKQLSATCTNLRRRNGLCHGLAQLSNMFVNTVSSSRAFLWPPPHHGIILLLERCQLTFALCKEFSNVTITTATNIGL